MARPLDPTPVLWPVDTDPSCAIEVRTFPARADQVAASRRLARDSLTRYPTFDRDIVELLVSELATNAILHSKSAEFSVAIAVTPEGHLRVAVTDQAQAASVPHLSESELDEVSGRGLWLVDSCATRWGIMDDNGRGVAVWFEVAQVPDPTSGEGESCKTPVECDRDGASMAGGERG